LFPEPRLSLGRKMADQRLGGYTDSLAGPMGRVTAGNPTSPAATEAIGSSAAAPTGTAIVPVGGNGLGQVSGSVSDLQEAFGGSNIRTSFVFELLDIRRPEALKVHVLVLNPQSYSLSEPQQSTLTPTQNLSVVTEETGILIREITLEGTFGVKTREPRSFSSSQGKKSGTDHFMDLRDMFRLYSDLKKSPEDGPYIRLVFHSLRDDDHFIVVPRTFDTPRDAGSSRMHYRYRLTMAAIANADATSLRIESRFNPFRVLDDAQKIVVEAFNTARAAFSELTAFIADVRRYVGNADAILLNASALIDSVGNAIRAGLDTYDFAYELAIKASEGVEIAKDDFLAAFGEDSDFLSNLQNGKILRAFRDLSNSLDALVLFPNRFSTSYTDRTENVEDVYAGEQRLTRLDYQTESAGASIGSAVRLFFGDGKNNGIRLGGYNGARIRRIVSGESIESIANEERVPIEAILLVNDLRYPYIAEGGGPGAGVGHCRAGTLGVQHQKRFRDA